MTNIGQRERLTQQRAVDLFRNSLGYRYLGNWHDRDNNRNVEESFLTPWLAQRGYSETLIARTLHQ